MTFLIKVLEMINQRMKNTLKAVKQMFSNENCNVRDCMPHFEENTRCVKFVWIPPVFDEVEKEVVVRPEWIEYKCTSPVWKEIEQVVECPYLEYYELNEDCDGELVICEHNESGDKTITVYELESEGSCEEIVHPAEIQIVKCKEVVEPGHYEWVEIDCPEGNPSVVR